MPDAIDMAINAYDEEILRQEGEKLKSEMQSSVGLQGFKNEMKDTFYANLDELYIGFYDQYSRNETQILDNEEYMLRKFLNYLKKSIK